MRILNFARRNWKFLVIYFILIPLLSFLTYIQTLPLLWLALLIPILSVLGQYEPIKKRWDNYKQRKEIKQRAKRFNKVLLEFEHFFKENFLKFDDVEVKENLIEYSKTVFPPNKDIYLKIFFFFLKEKSDFVLNNFEKTSLSEEITSATRNFSLQNPSTENLRLAWGFNQLLCEENESQPIDLTKPADREFLNEECFQNKFVKRYVSKEEVISKLTSERQDLEEYRQTLSTLLDSGKLDKYGIQKAISDFDEEFEEVITDRTHVSI